MTCALWYMRNGRADYRLFDDEDEAARTASDFSETDYAAVLGVQYEDGSAHRREEWPAFCEEEDRRNTAVMTSTTTECRATVPVPTRMVRDPFEGHHLHVQVDEPEWLGIRGAGIR